MSEKSSLQDIQRIIHDWINKHGGYWPPLAMLSAVIEEVGELAKEINHLEGYKPKKKKNEKIRVGEELADIIYAVVCIANYYKIDLNTELKNVIDKYSERDSKRFI
ncbi:MAG: nucleotide pyrophosphohydrolase [Candidatus Lokiarchaeota archaeon]|nr:nucleotide pyrophosphohydrolase [Candidatus Lokiarchaeota archaeon]